MKNFVVAVLGASATGKSTRVMQIVKFAEKYLGGWVPVNYENKDKEKKYQIGMYNDQLNLIVVGKLYCSGNIERFQGHDAMTGKFGTSANYSEWLKSVSNKHNVLVEGYSAVHSFRSRAEHLMECGFGTVMNLTFCYDGDSEDYYNRIFLRSGKRPKSDAAWKSNRSMLMFHESAKKELKKFSLEKNGILLTHNEDVNYIGVKLFETFYKEVPALVDLFKKFVIEFNYVEQNKFENFN